MTRRLSGSDPVHLDDDARSPLSVSEAGVRQAGALAQRAAFKLADFLDGLLVLFCVFTHHTQVVTLLKAVVIICREKTTNISRATPHYEPLQTVSTSFRLTRVLRPASTTCLCTSAPLVLTLQEVVQLLDVLLVVCRVTAVERDFSCMRTNHQTCTQKHAA